MKFYNWKKYLKAHEARKKPREQLVRAASYAKKGKALDLGAGNCIEAKYLIKKGFTTVAVDNAPEAEKHAKSIRGLHFKNVSFQEYDYPKNNFNLITSQYSLHLYGHKGFNSFIRKIKNSLKKGGIFAAQFLGVKDSWNGDPSKADYVFLTKKQVLNLLSGLDVLEFKEEDEDGRTVFGKTKHWHLFHFIARKK